MLNVSIILLPVAIGDRGCWRKVKNARHHKIDRSTKPWSPRQVPPQPDTDELRRRVQQFREAVRVQHEALLSAGRAVMATGG
jgi:hypothetical protein